MIRNGQAVALLGLGKPEEAEPILQDAMDKVLCQSSLIIDLLMILEPQWSGYTDKHDRFVSNAGKAIRSRFSDLINNSLKFYVQVTNRYITQLKDSHEGHPFVKDYVSKEAEFDLLMNNYGVGLAMWWFYFIFSLNKFFKYIVWLKHDFVWSSFHMLL